MSGQSENSNSTASSPPPSSPGKVAVATIAPQDAAVLAAAVRAQVEYYFSKDNLKNDSFLISQMDSQNSVAISVILNFAKLKALTQDESVVADALKDSTAVILVDGRIKSVLKTGRNTIILREIPSDTAEEAIRDIFNFPGCKPLTSVKSDIGDTWFVVFESEADAKDVVLDLKLKKRMFNGASVKARLKSEAVVNRSYYPTSAPIANSIYPVMYPYNTNGQMDLQPRFGYASQLSPGSDAGGRNGEFDGSSGKTPAGNMVRMGDRDSTRGGDRSRLTGGKGGGGRDHNGRDNNSRNGDTSRRNNNTHNRGGNAGRDGQSRSSPRQQPVIEINSLNFPPLPPQGPGGEDQPQQQPVTSPAANQPTIAAVVAAAATEDYSTIGYGEKPFNKYQIDDILNIVKNIKEAVLPDTIKTTEHPLAMVSSPNVDLLLRQRTFSIDETREQMQQGRPVQREAVIAGDVDYNSVMYGEQQDDAPGGETTPQAGTNTTTGGKPDKKQKSGGSWAGVLKATSGPPSTASITGSSSKASHAGKAGGAEKTTTAAANKASSSDTSAGRDNHKKVTEGGKKLEAGKKAAGGASGRKDDGGGAKPKPSGGGKKGGNSNISNNNPRNNGRNRNEQKEKVPSEPADPPLKWGDKPSFANILKAKEDKNDQDSPVDTEAAIETKTAPQTAAGTVADSSKAPRKQRSRSGSESSTGGGGHGGKNKAQQQQHPSNEDGNWSKQKLPPLKKLEP